MSVLGDVNGCIEKKKLYDKFIWLAWYPDNETKQFKRYAINSVKFHTKDSEATRKTQNSKVCVLTEGGATYYGVLIDIIELNYSEKYQYVLFKCQCVGIISGRGCKKDEFGFAFVNFSWLIHTGSQLVSQASQVFYVEDVRHKDWVVVVKTKPREVFDVGINASHDDDDDDDDDDEVGTYLLNVPYTITTNDACDDANDNHA